MIVIQIARHGNNNWCGYNIYRDNASFANTPHEAVGADTPKPKKLKNASLKIALGTANVRFTMITPKLFGIKCLSKIFVSLTPSVRTARTYSMFFRPIT